VRSRPTYLRVHGDLVLQNVFPPRAEGLSDPPTTIGERRQPPWLLSDYNSDVWSVCDSHDRSRVATIDFRQPMADGRSLTEVESIYATTKEYACWIRDSRFSNIQDAQTHATMVRNLMNLAHGLSIRNIWSFAHVQPYDVETLVEECRYGVDAILHASDRVDAYLKQLAAANEGSQTPYGGLPRYSSPSSGKRFLKVDAARIVASCNLPACASRIPRVAALIGQAAEANGLNPNGGKTKTPEPLRNVTVQALRRSLDPLEQLYQMRRHMEAETLTFKPFAVGASRVAAVKGVGTKRTPIPPPALALHLLSESANWVLTIDDGSIRTMDQRTSLRTATASWILIAAFSARRDEEIDDLDADCLRGDDEAGWWLNVYIEKTLQRMEWIPVPAIVARAVQLMHAVSADARSHTSTSKLFQWLSPEGDIRHFNVGRHLDDFAAFVKTPLHRTKAGIESAWHWHPHQFRRLFAVLYFYRFEGATVEVLSHHLRHFSLEMTRKYVTLDPEVAALWSDVEWGYMGHVARAIVSGQRSVSGGAGTRLKKIAMRLLDVFRRKLQVASPERVGASLTMIMQRQGMVLTPKPWVTCSCPQTTEAAAVAACRAEKSMQAHAKGPDFSNAGPTICKACPHAITEGSRTNFVDDEVSHLERAAEASDRRSTLFGELEAARLIEVRNARDTQYASAKPIEVTG
jgi:hypothetical protein